MTEPQKALVGPDIFDGETLYRDHALVLAGGRVAGIVPRATLDPALPVDRLEGGVILPGFVDLQVNGGGGVMFNEDPSVGALRRMARAHAGLGATSILPTLITDASDKTDAAIEAVADAVAEGVPGILGLHLEGPHLDVRRKGAHEARFIRPMTDADVDRLLRAAKRLPLVKMTLAPESARPDQIRALSAAGVLVSLGHSDTGFDVARQAADAGARCVTHLFNAMSQLGNREPGLVGAALALGGLSAGLIADGVHVHPETVTLALRAKQGPGRIFLVSDAMAVAGTDAPGFELGGRRVLRRDGRLTLEDGTLAGADLDQLTAVRNLLAWQAVPVDTALAMATSVPAQVAGLSDGTGTLKPGAPADFLHVDLQGDAPARVWQAGQPVPES